MDIQLRSFVASAHTVRPEHGSCQRISAPRRWAGVSRGEWQGQDPGARIAIGRIKLGDDGRVSLGDASVMSNSYGSGAVGGAAVVDVKDGLPKPPLAIWRDHTGCNYIIPRPRRRQGKDEQARTQAARHSASLAAPMAGLSKTVVANGLIRGAK